MLNLECYIDAQEASHTQFFPLKITSFSTNLSIHVFDLFIMIFISNCLP